MDNDPSGRDFESPGVAFSYDAPDNVQTRQPAVIVAPHSECAWSRLLKLEPKSLDWLPIQTVVPSGAHLPLEESVPVLFWGNGYQDGNKPFAERRDDGSVVFYVDIIAAIFFMLSRWEETVIPTRDEHGRFPGTASVAYKQDLLDRPIVDEYALILREWIKTLVPDWKPNPRPFSVKLSHDVDRMQYFPNWSIAVRTLGRDVLKHRSPKRAWQTGIEAIAQAIAPDQNPYYQSIRSLAELSHEYGLGNDAFYFMAAEPAPWDNGYNPASLLVKRCIEDLRQQGFEIGFHPGYHTFDNPERLAAEKARIDRVFGETSYGGRQHYLRFRVPDTWQHWAQVGLTYDSTMIHADHEGFRCGTCHPFRPFDVKRNRELDLWEYPLIVMDVTLHQYRKLTPDQGKARILELARRCQRVGGTFTLLWHNSSVGKEWQPWWRVYEQVVEILGKM
jgi:hypothetical protein